MKHQLPNAWFALRHHALQQKLYTTKARFVCVAAGRGSGKTEIARRRIVRMLPVKKQWSNPLYFFALPTYAQAKRVAWKPLKALVPKSWVAKIHESDLKIETVFGSTLYVLGMDKPERAEGVQWDGGVLDESSDQRPKIFDTSILPALTHRKAFCWRIGVPKRYGVGAKEFKEAFDKGIDSADPLRESYTWPSADILTEEEITWASENLDPRDFNEQYNANWEQASGGIFYAFTKDNVSIQAEYNSSLPIWVGSDFNVDPMAWVLCHRVRDNGVEKLVVFDEIWKRNTNTQQTLDYLYEHYKEHKAGWEFYGDASGSARKTSATTSDYLQILNDNHYMKKQVYYPRSNPLRVNRFAACNAMFCNADNRRRVLINPRCTHLISDLEQRAYKEGSREPNDFGDIGHITDAFGYVIYMRYPLKLTRAKEVSPIISARV